MRTSQDIRRHEGGKKNDEKILLEKIFQLKSLTFFLFTLINSDPLREIYFKGFLWKIFENITKKIIFLFWYFYFKVFKIMSKKNKLKL